MLRLDVLLSAAALGASFATLASATPESVQAHVVLQQAAAPVYIAKNGADDGAPTCDDHGTDLCSTAPMSVAKNGADDGAPTCDDHGSDLCVTRSA